MVLLVTLIFIYIISCASAAINKYVNLTGDIMLGGLFPIHKKGRSFSSCAEIQVAEGFQMVESMLYAVQQINKNESILPGVKLGVLAFDTCDDPAYALEQSLDFIKGFIAHYNSYHQKEYECHDGSTPLFRKGDFDQVVAIIGGQSSAVTIQVASVLRMFETPIISYLATSPALNNGIKYPSFFRTVPSDINQAKAMLELFRKFNWTYVSIVHSDTEYGTYGYENLNYYAPDYGICFATPLRIRSDEDYDKVVSSLANNTDSRVVVVFAELPTVVLRLAEVARNQGVGNRYVWVGSHGWGVSSYKENYRTVRDNSVSNMFENQEVLEGALAMQPLTGRLRGFDEYFTSLDLEKHQKINPWFKEYWQTFFHCKLPPDSHENFTDKDSAKYCRADLKLDASSGYKQHTVLHFVRDAVYAVAQALHNMKQELCPNVSGLCESMQHIDGKLLAQYISKVQFNDDHGNLFKFLNGRDGPPRYSILNLQRTQNNTFQWKVVGNYTLNELGNPVIHIDHNILRYKNGLKEFPPSSCNQECELDQIKVREHEDTCCWSCEYCGEFEIRKDDYHCLMCPKGFISAPNKTTCQEVPEEYICYRNPWAIVALSVATFGIMISLIVAFIFWANSETPVIKASGRELSYLLLFGTFLEFGVTYVMVAAPTVISCGITKFVFGFCFTLCYAAMVTKTIRISRIFNSRVQNVHKKRFTSPFSQLMITGLLTSVEVVINTAWLILDPPKVIQVVPAQDQRLRICSGLGDFSYLIGLSYPFVLIAICTAYAFKTRKCPEGFNEARHIVFTNYTAIMTWVAFVPLYLASTNNAIRIVTLAMSLSLSGLVQLGCLFLPKIYIVIFTPEKNTKEVVMGHYRTSSVSINPGNTGFDSNVHFSSSNGFIHGYRNHTLKSKTQGHMITSSSTASTSSSSRKNTEQKQITLS